VPRRIDETHDAALPVACPTCGGEVHGRHVVSQYQEDLPVVRSIIREFRVHVGACVACGRRVQGRHPLQTSDALGAAAVHIGPEAVALVVVLHKGLGLPLAHVVTLLRDRFGIRVTRGALVHVCARAAARATPTYQALCVQVRDSPVVSPDETGLWAATTPDTTVYAIQQGRGFAEATTLLGSDFAGVVVRDGWAPYRRFEKAVHQSCLAHLLRRCRTLILDHRDRRLAPRVQRILQQALRVRDRYYAGRVSARGVAIARGHLQNQLNALIDRPGRAHVSRRFAAHLAVEFPAVFTFLLEPDAIDATNWRAEQALRPAVVTRKVCGGNRSERSAEAHAVLASVLRTIQQRQLDAAIVFSMLLRSPQPTAALAPSPQP
jgi:transposase